MISVFFLKLQDHVKNVMYADEDVDKVTLHCMSKFWLVFSY